MKNIIPFKKDVMFKTNLNEITSISLEHTLSIEKDNINGEFIISGDYKLSNTSTSTEPFNIKIPFDITIDEKYNTDKAIVDIDDFYYEIVNENILSISIDVLVDKLEEKIVEEKIDEEEDVEPFVKVEKIEVTLDRGDEEENMEIIDNCVEEQENKEVEKINVSEKIESLFDNISTAETYVSYNVCIIREGDNLESILEKYGVTEDTLKKYNTLNDLKIGDKLIIPNINETD